MNTKPARLFVLSICVFAAACEAELKVGGFDGSIFPDAGDEDSGGGGSGGGGQDAATGDSATGTDAGTDAGNAIHISEVPQLLANAVCAALEACEGTQLLTDSLNGEDCADVTGNVFSARELSALGDSVADGRIEFDPTRMAACVAAISAQACDVQTLRRPVACEDALKGKVALGADCVTSDDCSGTSTFCQPQAQCPGTCATLLTANTPCTNSDQCANGTLCAVVNSVRQCVAPGGPAAPCGLDSTPLCKRGFSCTPDMGGGSTCKSNSIVYVRQAGQTCDPPASMCDRGLVCTNTPTGLECAAIAATDGACFRAQPSHCPAGQYCDAVTMTGGTCLDLPEEGETCLASTRSQRCAPNFACLGDGLCHIKGENGDSCDENAECYSGNCGGTVCDPPASLCTL